MTKAITLAIVFLAMLVGTGLAQEVIIADFPIGVGGSIDRALLQPYLGGLHAIADTLHKYPLARAIIIGGADGIKYDGAHDAKNPGLALGRAHLLRDLLISEFKIDSSQLVVQSEDVLIEGGAHRYAAVRIDRTLADLDTRLKELENRPPIERHFTEVREPATNSFLESLGLQFGLGVSTTPYGGLPVVSAAMTWERTVFVEGIAGHTFWDGSFRWEDMTLDTKRRLIGGQLIVFPFERLPLGLVGGWVRVEEISQQHYEYVKMSEGPLVGVRLMPLRFLSVTGVYNPTKQRLSGRELSTSDNDQIQISAAAHIAFGGAK